MHPVWAVTAAAIIRYPTTTPDREGINWRQQQHHKQWHPDCNSPSGRWKILSPKMAGLSYKLGSAAALAILIVMQGAAPVAGWNTLVQGYYLAAGSRLVEGDYIFIMQDDCNLVLYFGTDPNPGGDGVLWASNTNGLGTACYFLLQRDGNAVLYTSAGTAVFQTGTQVLVDGPKLLTLQCDGNVVLYNALGTAHWATNTGGLEPPLGLAPRHGPALNTKFAEQQHIKIARNTTA